MVVMAGDVNALGDGAVMSPSSLTDAPATAGDSEQLWLVSGLPFTHTFAW